MTDIELLNGIAKGDPLAGRIFVDRYQLQVYNVCYSFLHNSHDAEDLAQEVFIEAIRNASKFRGDAKLSTWLYRIATNRSLNFIRDNRKRRFRIEIDALFGLSGNDVPKTGVEEPSVSDDALEQNEQKNILAKAIASLPLNQRTAFTLNRLDDLSYAEIAEIMEVSLSAVESMIHRARLNLRKKLSVYYLQ
ncbi:MAG: RNA polymerase sigma factor [Lentimicrobiaceae bacterium]|nr:RNA polymerase sigma factor [Lentimicrobiaceae bacterium]MCB9023093.1 RNA polymerase sigma factor [Lentimicrobiaceae bacterium]MCO5264618.1 RNA polymerase sigma factor [Lentimicrobium sp.]